MADKTLKSLNFGGADNYFPLPIVSTNDNDNLLVVADGEWTAKSPNDITGQYVWSKHDSVDGPVTGYVISNDGEKYPDGGWSEGVFYKLELKKRILIRIEITTAPTTVEYIEGDSLDLSGLVVTATFDDGSTEDVTSQCIMSPSAGTILTTTDTSVNISYTYKGVTRSTSQIIMVADAVISYLSFLGNEDFTLKTYNKTKSWDGTLEYSTDTTTWSTWDGTEISSVGSKLYLRGTGNTKITGDSSNYRFVFTGASNLKIACEGNIENLLDYNTVSSGGHPTMANGCYSNMFNGCTSLTTAPSLPATTLATICYGSMFYGCSSLTTAPALPATTLANNCYRYMFNGCTSLTTAPALPATTLANGCYNYMFYGCRSLTTAPALPATTLAGDCYNAMFYGCKSLTTAPSLPATTLYNYCYGSMFNGCTSLTTAPELPATKLANYCYNDMFNGCTSLTTAPELPATTLYSYCYNYMFYNCSSLTTAPDLPATTLAEDCYNAMFRGCTSLTTAPELPATTLAGSCYGSMFQGCASLTTVHALPATTLADYCYAGMFSGCTSLTTAPELPATTLATYCYNSMFKGCTKIKLSTTQTGEYQTTYRIPKSGEGTTANNALNSMFDNTGGTFTGTPSINTTYYLSTSNTVV